MFVAELKNKAYAWIIRESLQRSCPKLVQKVYGLEDGFKGFMKPFPTLDRLTVQKTVSHPIDTVPEDESTVSGNLAILENILFNQCGFDRGKDMELWTKGLRLCYGDQKTWARLWSILKAGDEIETPGYGQMKWLLPVPALFHLKLCFLKIIHQTFWAPSQKPQRGSKKRQTKSQGGPGTQSTSIAENQPYQTTHSYLRLGAAQWKRKRIANAKNNEFYALEEFILHSFDTRILVLLWERLIGSSDISSLSNDEIETEVEKQLERLEEAHLEQIIEDVCACIVEWDLTEEQDPERRNHGLLLQMIQPYLLLKTAIHFGDIGFISRALDIMCLYFNGSRSFKYAYLTLWWVHHTHTKAVDPKLARAILANSMVNTSGKEGGFKEIDLYNEHLNKEIKETLRNRANSSFNFEHVMTYASVNSPFFHQIRSRINRLFDVFNSGRHTVKSAVKDIHDYAHILRTDSFCHKGPDKRVTTCPAPDLFASGLDSIRTRITRYNETLPGAFLASEGSEDLEQLMEEEAADVAADFIHDVAPEDDVNDDQNDRLEIADLLDESTLVLLDKAHSSVGWRHQVIQSV